MQRDKSKRVNVPAEGQSNSGIPERAESLRRHASVCYVVDSMGDVQEAGARAVSRRDYLVVYSGETRAVVESVYIQL